MSDSGRASQNAKMAAIVLISIGIGPAVFTFAQCWSEGLFPWQQVQVELPPQCDQLIVYASRPPDNAPPCTLKGGK
jgi:hypothetical protein